MEKENEIFEILEKINTKSDFENFLKKLRENYDAKKEDWENDTLESYLEALHGYSQDSKNEKPSWKVFAAMLIAAKVYE